MRDRGIFVTIESIRTHLNNALSPSYLKITDESAKHIGHPGAASGGGHYAIEISAAAFQGKNLIESHRMIYKALDTLMGKEIHALKIKIIL
jgi:BolA protein